jgi:hypothetical protein
VTNESHTLFGEPIEVRTESGVVENVTLRQLRVREYPLARRRLDNEPSLIDLACQKPDGWSETLTPESYDALATRLPEVNALFFASCARQARTQLSLLPDELRRALTVSIPSSPAPPSPAG